MLKIHNQQKNSDKIDAHNYQQISEIQKKKQKNISLQIILVILLYFKKILKNLKR